jgi:hypothetical protein
MPWTLAGVPISLWLCRNNKVFNDKTLPFAGYIQGYQYSLFMVISTKGGGLRPIYGGLCTVEGYGEGYFLPTLVKCPCVATG